MVETTEGGVKGQRRVEDGVRVGSGFQTQVHNRTTRGIFKILRQGPRIPETQSPGLAEVL